MNDATPIDRLDAAIVALEARPRDVRAEALCLAIAACDPADASLIMVEALQDMETGGPQHDALGTLRSDAAWWAETAPQHEVQEYVHEGMKRLAARALGRTTRLRLIASLWNGLSAEDKAAFLARVTGQGGG